MPQVVVVLDIDAYAKDPQKPYKEAVEKGAIELGGSCPQCGKDFLDVGEVIFAKAIMEDGSEWLNSGKSFFNGGAFNFESQTIEWLFENYQYWKRADTIVVCSQECAGVAELKFRQTQAEIEIKNNPPEEQLLPSEPVVFHEPDPPAVESSQAAESIQPQQPSSPTEPAKTAFVPSSPTPEPLPVPTSPAPPPPSPAPSQATPTPKRGRAPPPPPPRSPSPPGSPIAPPPRSPSPPPASSSSFAHRHSPLDIPTTPKPNEEVVEGGEEDTNPFSPNNPAYSASPATPSPSFENPFANLPESPKVSPNLEARDSEVKESSTLLREQNVIWCLEELGRVQTILAEATKKVAELSTVLANLQHPHSLHPPPPLPPLPEDDSVKQPEPTPSYKPPVILSEADDVN